MSFPMPPGNPCFMCEIVTNLSSHWSIIDHDEVTVTVLNGRQFEIGQCLIIPKRHAPTLLDLTKDEAGNILASAQRLTQSMVSVFQPEGVLLYQNNGTGSGQEVPHFHLHVVPRQPGSDWGLGPPHIAHLESGSTPESQRHTVVTERKRQTVSQLRASLKT